ncbi:FAD/NAD(P)-binding protein [uncultured Aquimarina sp.]|uniref:FAD/NAD(P)-binding protein n=1 Tax=uncultured Aquimarina sp. TaxID=575652 RepID=UPI0026204653|nr:FAD/NAD(P)-binding protein [uncultured Aquimarina sp.]
MRQIAIIGTGPRGLSALESFFVILSKGNPQKDIKVTLFEPSDVPGTGTAWNTRQADTNWLNITERALKNLEGRPAIHLNEFGIPAFPSYTDWLPIEEQNLPEDAYDQFPPRRKLGNYLNQRFESIFTVLEKEKLAVLKNTTIEAIDYKENVFFIKDITNTQYQFEEIVLTIGHQPTILSDQLQQWKKHAMDNNLNVFIDPYPVKNILDTPIDTDACIGIRGFGLAMIDVMRALTIGCGGSFTITNKSTFESVYHHGKKTTQCIVPFSLDGNPMIPKPINAAIDAWFTPTDSEIETFKHTISAIAQGSKKVSNIWFLKNVIADIASRIYQDLGEKSITHNKNASQLHVIITNWLTDESHQDPLIQPIDNPASVNIEAFINMALGKSPISLDYCIGQVWRHCQPTLYKEFSHPTLPDEIIAEVISLDERSKRYSYGPPVESMQQMMALVRADVLILDFANNPDIEFLSEGWQLRYGENERIINVMINSVLDAPQLLEVQSPIIKSLLSNDIISPIHSELGIHTQTNGCVVLPDSINSISLSVLGRLAKGSVIGVDAILECFGSRIKDWAESAVRRI